MTALLSTVAPAPGLQSSAGRPDLHNAYFAITIDSMSLEEVARRFRERSWPPVNIPRTSSYLEMAANALEDPEPYVPGSFDQVAAAYYRGELTLAQYGVLADAAAASVRAKSGES